jgi:hypothetical protein
LFYIPLGKHPHFDGEDNSWWSHKTCSHLFSLHPSIWNVVENRMHGSDSDDENYNAIYIQEIIHRNSQATIVLLACLCREEYNKASGWTTQRKYGAPSRLSIKGTQ